MARKKQRIDTSGDSNELSQNPFGNLDASGLPTGPSGEEQPSEEPRKKRRGRVEIRREKKGRGGKTVTTISGFEGIATSDLEELGKTLRQACGVGGTLKERTIELQGDVRKGAALVLESEGFSPVFAGG